MKQLLARLQGLEQLQVEQLLNHHAVLSYDHNAIGFISWISCSWYTAS